VTTSDARRYQNLRAHLGYLKLNDAADALNSVLDAARNDGLSLTAALERLLEIEVGSPKPAAWPAICGSPACPGPGPSPTSTSPPNPASTRNSSATSRPCGSSTTPPTSCSSAHPGSAKP
jgi:hypothetical protein